MVVGTKAYGCNEARAAGGNSSGRPNKKFQLKSQLNDSNVHSTIAYVQILGTGMDTHDTLPSVLLFFDKQRFIFNAGEGLQRFCAEHKIKLSKIDHICLSRVCSETTGGLPGLLLTLAGTGEGISVNLWGPSNLDLLVKAMRSFIPHAAMVHTHLISHAAMDHSKSFELASYSSGAASQSISRLTEPIMLVENRVIKISAILLQPSCLEGSDFKLNDISVIYVCELHEVMGKFNKEKAEALGLKVKTKYRELQNGNSVKSDCLDIMVHPSDVMGPSTPGPIVFIVDCPTNSHVEELLSKQSLNVYYSDSMLCFPESAKTVNCIIHLTPPSVVNSVNYEKWMKKFDSAQHIMVGHAMNHVTIPILKSSARMATRLNYLCPQFFPASAFWSVEQHNNATLGSITSTEGLSQLCERISAENLLKFTLRPNSHLGLDKSNVSSLFAPSKVIDELLSEIPEIADVAQHVSKFWEMPGAMKQDEIAVQDDTIIFAKSFSDGDILPCLKNIRRDDLEIVFLGTGSSQPSKYRNVSSIYINLFSKGSLLLDCGEGTLAQLRRRYGMEGADDAVRNLRCIWISHIHADHHAGIVRILALRRDLLKRLPHEQLLVIGPLQLEQFLSAYQRLEYLDMQFLDCRNTTLASWNALEGDIESNKNWFFSENLKNAEDINNKNTISLVNTSFVGAASLQGCSKRMKLSFPIQNEASPLLKRLKEVLWEVGLERLISFPVIHCPESFGIVLQATKRLNTIGEVIPGWKLVYSGDTRPCLEVIKASNGATILIHEATFEDCMVEDAIRKNHSTTKEAIEVGDSAAAYRVILTHFSQRYPKIPALDEISIKKTCIAFDLMSINIADLPVLPNILPFLQLLFRKETITDK